MKAIVYTRLGAPEVLQLAEVDKPVPAADQVLVRVKAASINALDYRRFAGQLNGEPVPLAARLMDGLVMRAVGKVLGADIAGRVEAVGAAVTRFKPGDEVFGIAGGNVGGFAEYACAHEDHLALKPAGMSFEDAAAAPVAGLTALQTMRDAAQLKAGQTVLIYGAGGGVGMFTVQIARAFGAVLTAVCGPRNLDTVRALGADLVVDYEQEDVLRGGQQFDLIAAVNGSRSLADYRRMLKPAGKLIFVGGSVSQALQSMTVWRLVSRPDGQTFGFMGIAHPTPERMDTLADLLGAGTVRPVIDRCYPLGETAQAMRYTAEGHARGKVVIAVGRADQAA